MKKVLIGVLALVMILGMVLGLVGCSSSNEAETSSNEAEKYIGEWYGSKIETESNTITFSDYASIVKMELIAEFKSDETYVLHYYVNGEEGEEYPQTGTYTVENGKLILSDEGTGEIVNDELILSFDNGQVKQYFSRQ